MATSYWLKDISKIKKRFNLNVFQLPLRSSKEHQKLISIFFNVLNEIMCIKVFMSKVSVGFSQRERAGVM